MDRALVPLLLATERAKTWGDQMVVAALDIKAACCLTWGRYLDLRPVASDKGLRQVREVILEYILTPRVMKWQVASYAENRSPLHSTEMAARLTHINEADDIILVASSAQETKDMMLDLKLREVTSLSRSHDLPCDLKTQLWGAYGSVEIRVELAKGVARSYSLSAGAPPRSRGTRRKDSERMEGLLGAEEVVAQQESPP